MCVSNTLNHTLQDIEDRRSPRCRDFLGLATVWLGVLFLIKDEVLRFMGEQEGEFMAVIPVGYAGKVGNAQKKIACEMRIKWLE